MLCLSGCVCQSVFWRLWSAAQSSGQWLTLALLMTHCHMPLCSPRARLKTCETQYEMVVVTAVPGKGGVNSASKLCCVGLAIRPISALHGPPANILKHVPHETDIHRTNLCRFQSRSQHRATNTALSGSCKHLFSAELMQLPMQRLPLLRHLLRLLQLLLQLHHLLPQSHNLCLLS